jgi:hypothetical protein
LAELLTTEERSTLFELHEDLVNIPSISDDEIECAEWLEGYLNEKGYYVERILVTTGAEGRFDVFAYPQAIRDGGNWPEVLITSHIDTASLPMRNSRVLCANENRYPHLSHSRDVKRTAQRITLDGEV